jgi:hypothetical protein
LNRVDQLKQRAAMRRRIRVVIAQRRLSATVVEPPSEPEPRD